MFSLIWRFFPGPAWLRLIIIFLLIIGLILLLVFVVYPFVATIVPSPVDSTLNTLGTFENSVASSL